MRLKSITGLVRREIVKNHLLLQVSSYAQSQSPVRILDVGSGIENWSKEFTDLKHCIYETVELKPDLNPTYQGDIYDLKASHKFDLIIATELIEHLEDPHKFFAKCHDLLVSHGQLVISFPFLFRVHGDPDDYFRFTENGVKLLFDEWFQVQRSDHHGNRFQVAWECLIDGRVTYPLRLLNYPIAKLVSFKEKTMPLGYVMTLRCRN